MQTATDQQQTPLLWDTGNPVDHPTNPEAEAEGYNMNEDHVDNVIIGEDPPHDIVFKYGTSAAKLPQFIATIICCLAPVSFGTVLGYSSPTINQLISLGLLDKETSSWHASIVTLGAVGGGLVGGVLINKLGRKGTLIACGVPFTIGWLMIMAVSVVNSLVLLLGGRFLTGLTMGVVCIAAPTYIAEIATPQLRGTLCNLFQLAVSLGLLLTFALGIPLTWLWLAVACAVIAVCMSIATLFIPESPIYLVSKGREEQALASLRWLRGTEYDYHEEYQSIVDALDVQPEGRVTPREIVTEKGIYKPMLITFGLMVFQQCSGINDFMFYTESIFKSAGSDNAQISGLIIGATQVCATLLSVFIMDVAGRRVLILLSGTFMTVGCVTLGLFYYLHNVTGITGIGWLPLASLILYVIAFSIGWGPIPWTMMAEIVPMRTKGLTSGMAVFINWISAFVVTKEFPDMESAMTMHGVFWFFAGVNVLGLVFSALCVPETKGKSLTEIERQFQK